MKINKQIFLESRIPVNYARVASIWEMKDIVTMLESVVTDLKISSAENLEVSFFQNSENTEIMVAIKYINGELNHELIEIAQAIGDEVINRRALDVADEIANDKKNLSEQIDGERGYQTNPHERR